jgi:DNA-binding protein WhiA
MPNGHEPSFTEAVRQELSRRELGPDVEVRAELSALVRLAGTLTLAGGEQHALGLDLVTGSGAVARRTFALVQRGFALRPELLVRAPGGVRRRSTYGVRIATGARRVATELGVLDATGRLVDGLPDDLGGGAALAYLRGAVLAAGSVSSPGRDPHLEVLVGSERVAEELAALLRDTIGGTVGTAVRPRPRVVMKSGQRIGDLLAAIGASGAFLAWDDRRLRRQLRGDANRLANADAANLRRTIDAAAAQVEAVERVVASLGWDRLDDDLRAIALARLANPAATLAELGELLGVGKSAVHRRLRRFAELAATLEPPPPADGTSRGEGPTPT